MEHLLDESLGTIFDRWYVTLFGLTFAWCSVRHLGWRRTALYAGVAFTVGALAENGSVHLGFPYTRYAFNEALRGDELFVGDVPVFVPLSYTFMGYFAFASGRLLASGPRRLRAPRPWMEYVLGVVLAVWALWVIDPVSRLGEDFYLGEVFAYDGPGFWFGLPLGSQAGFTLTSVVLVGVLSVLARREPDAAVRTWTAHPHLLALVVYHVQVFHIAVVAFVIGADALGGAAFLLWVPIAGMTAVHWTTLGLGVSRSEQEREAGQPVHEVGRDGDGVADELRRAEAG
jgi:uncharacterized membrane protein